MTARPARRFARSAAAALAAVAMLAVAACGSDSATPQAQPTQEPTGAPTAPAPDVPQVEPRAFPALVKHAWGITRIESEPTRIVVLGFTEQDTMVSLGVRPLTVRNYFGEEHPWTAMPWLSDFARGGEYEVLYNPIRDPNTGRTEAVTRGPILGNGFAQAANTPGRRQKEVFDLNAIEAMNPDLILAMFSGISFEDHAALTEIAPTIGMVSDPDLLEYYSSWQEQIASLGTALGRPSAARELVAQVTDRFTEFREAHPEVVEASVAVVAPGPNGKFKLINPYAPLGRFFTTLRMEFPSRIYSATSGGKFDPSTYAVELPNSSLGLLDDLDSIVWVVGHDGGEAMAEMKATSAYQNLRSVEQGNVVELGPDLAEALYYNSPASLNWLLDQIEPKLVAALGDKAAADAQAEREARERAEAEGDVIIDFQPTESPQPYQIPEGGETPEPDPSAGPGGPAGPQGAVSGQSTPGPAPTNPAPSPTPTS